MLKMSLLAVDPCKQWSTIRGERGHGEAGRDWCGRRQCSEGEAVSFRRKRQRLAAESDEGGSSGEENIDGTLVVWSVIGSSNSEICELNIVSTLRIATRSGSRRMWSSPVLT